MMMLMMMMMMMTMTMMMMMMMMMITRKAYKNVNLVQSYDCKRGEWDRKWPR